MHLVRQCAEENRLNALASDITYCELWALAETLPALRWPGSENLLLKFIVRHL
jgi:hypothetical protein